MSPRHQNKGEEGYRFDPIEELERYAPIPYGAKDGKKLTFFTRSITIAIGGGSAPDLVAGVERAKPFLHENECTKVMILSWCGNGVARKTSRKRYYDLGEKRLQNV